MAKVNAVIYTLTLVNKEKSGNWKTVFKESSPEITGMFTIWSPLMDKSG